MRISLKDKEELAWKLSVPLATAVFLGAAVLLFPTLGLEPDELLYVRAIIRPLETLSHIQIGHKVYPLMIMSYLGALRSWLYRPIVRNFGFTTASVRIPAIILAALALILFARLLRNISGPWAGVFMVWMLATDVTFLSTATFDWGPVVLQHLFLAAMLSCLLLWERRRYGCLVFAGGLAGGLALWDKAIFLWNLSSMAIVFVCLGFPFLRSLGWRALPRSFGLLTAGILLGAFPLIAYNVAHRGETISGNTHLTTAEMKWKETYLLRTADGLADESFSDPAYPAPDHIARPFSDIAKKIAPSKNPPEVLNISSWRIWLFVALIPIGLALADWPQRKWILFFLFSGALSWLQAALTSGAGASIHHVVLMWPLLYASLAVCAAAIAHRARRWGSLAIAAVVLVFAMRGLQEIDVLYVNLISYSPGVQFSDGEEALVSCLNAAGIQRLLTVDWGIEPEVTVRTKGRILVLEDAYQLYGGGPIVRELRQCIQADCLIALHPESREAFPGINKAFDSSLSQNHLAKQLFAEIRDSHGTASYELYRLHEDAAAVPTE
jgi:hypothetical protein